MTCVAKELFIEKQAHILNIANYLNYAAIIPIIISVVEGIKFIREKHQEKIKQNENDVEPTPNQQERYRNSAV